MITFEEVSYAYAEATRPTLCDVTLDLPASELYVVAGVTGCGKSTFLRAMNGLVPHFTGGTLTGSVRVAGRDTRHHPPRQLADVVGFVGQQPSHGFVASTVEDELAYVMESLALPPDTMRRRVAEVIDLLGLGELRSRTLRRLSGGQQQRVAIGAALTAQPQVLVLDEPTSALDPAAAEEVLSILHRLVHDLGVTVVVAEHRLERVAQFADQVLWLPGDGSVVLDQPAAALAAAPIAPPVVKLGRELGWEPIPVSIRDARRHVRELAVSPPDDPEPAERPSPIMKVRGLAADQGDDRVLTDVTFDVAAGERLAVMGRNGVGKSTLLWTLQGGHKRTGGQVTIGDSDPATIAAAGRRRLISLLPQNHGDVLVAETVKQECADADAETNSNDCATILAKLAPEIDTAANPRDLSEGQRLALAVAVMATGSPQVLALDEPTRGLDYPTKQRLTDLLVELGESGTAVVVTTHDVEFVAQFATRVLILDDGEVVADGPMRAVTTSSPMFAPQVAKVFAPVPLLTVAEAVAAVHAAAEVT